MPQFLCHGVKWDSLHAGEEGRRSSGKRMTPRLSGRLRQRPCTIDENVYIGCGVIFDLSRVRPRSYSTVFQD